MIDEFSHIHRLDVETKIPDTLELSFYHCRPEEREAALLCLLKHVLDSKGLTVVFAATKHHVEFLHMVGKISTYVYLFLNYTLKNTEHTLILH